MDVFQIASWSTHVVDISVAAQVSLDLWTFITLHESMWAPLAHIIQHSEVSTKQEVSFDGSIVIVVDFDLG